MTYVDEFAEEFYGLGLNESFEGLIRKAWVVAKWGDKVTIAKTFPHIITRDFTRSVTGE